MIAGGLADPVGDSQGIFRAVLSAMSRPGTVATVGDRPSIAGLAPSAAAVALALADFETPLWLAPRCQEAAEALRFHCGAPITRSPREAAFAFAADVAELPALDGFGLGTDAFPDRSTTLVLEVASLETGRGLRLQGPGINGSARLAVGGIEAGFWTAREALEPLFPRGLDVVLVCGRRLAALPRTTNVEA
jgi:alpha-D-ribose 1-methylphosphonate 5-triphosphate synthase subunit PhnH